MLLLSNCNLSRRGMRHLDACSRDSELACNAALQCRCLLLVVFNLSLEIAVTKDMTSVLVGKMKKSIVFVHQRGEYTQLENQQCVL